MRQPLHRPVGALRSTVPLVERPLVDRQGGQVRDRLRHAAARSLVGRAREQAALLSMLRRGDGPAVVFVSGPGGIG